jgi:FkbM family methyltransferase
MPSQTNEDEIIQEYFGDRKGRFLDIGAYNGVDFSNTEALANRGWGGVCVEPSPIPFKDLLALYRERDDIQLCNCVITPGEPSGLDLFYDNRGDAVSSYDPTHMEVWAQQGCGFDPYLTWFLPINTLLAKIGLDFEFINIDVEGTNFALTAAILPLLGEKNEMLCVEAENNEAMKQMVQSHKYQLYKQTRENFIFLRNT